MSQKFNLTIQRVQGTYESESDGGSTQDQAADWGPVYLSATSRAVMLNWYRRAQVTVQARRGRRYKGNLQPAAEISGDEDDDNVVSPFAHLPVHLNAASTAIAIKWLRAARAAMQASAANERTAARKKKSSKQKGFKSTQLHKS